MNYSIMTPNSFSFEICEKYHRNFFHNNAVFTLWLNSLRTKNYSAQINFITIFENFGSRIGHQPQRVKIQLSEDYNNSRRKGNMKENISCQIEKEFQWTSFVMINRSEITCR